MRVRVRVPAGPTRTCALWVESGLGTRFCDESESEPTSNNLAVHSSATVLREPNWSKKRHQTALHAGQTAWIFGRRVRICTSSTNLYSICQQVWHGYPKPIKVIWYCPIANGLADLQHIKFCPDPQCWRQYYHSRTIIRAYQFACDVCFC
jgi:hypothetical protein